jgi:hypothetical protein
MRYSDSVLREGVRLRVSDLSKLCSTNWVPVASWPAECRLHHPWKPGTVTITWEPCDCPAAQAARDGHVKVRCNTPGCEGDLVVSAPPARAATPGAS